MADVVTTVVGSYPQPDWLIDRERLGERLPPRVRARELWRVPEPYLAEAQDDATRLAVQDMERAGVDIVTDGEMRRESYSNRFATALEGIDLDRPGVALDRTGHENPVPRVTGPVCWSGWFMLASLITVYFTIGGCSKVWNGAGLGTVHSRPSAPSQGLASALTPPRMVGITTNSRK